MLIPDLTVSVSQRRWSCVLDPALALATPFGSVLVRRLGALLDLWMVRAFWQVLDSSEYYRSHPGALTSEQSEDCVRRQLQTWERIRARTDLDGLKFCWIGDNQSESRLPEHAEPDLVERYELLCESLSRRPPPKVRLVRTLLDEQSAAAIEVAALACALNPAIVLTHYGASEGNAPRLCRDLARLGLDCHAVTVDADATLAVIEREHLRQVLVQAGATPLVLGGLQLAVIHVLAPDAALARTSYDQIRVDDGVLPDALEAPPVAVAEPDDDAGIDWWSGAQMFWYPLTHGAVAATARQADA